MAATTRMILSLVLSMLILTLPVFSWSLWEQGVDQTQNNAVGQAEPDRTSQAKNKAVGKTKTEIKRSPETTLKKNTNFWSQSSPLSHVEFKLIPYARVFDITDHSRPKLILDSHYATVRMKKGGYKRALSVITLLSGCLFCLVFLNGLPGDALQEGSFLLRDRIAAQISRGSY